MSASHRHTLTISILRTVQYIRSDAGTNLVFGHVTGPEDLPHDGDTQVWAKPLADGTCAVGLFNLGTNERPKSRYPSRR